MHSIISNELAELDKQLQGPASIQCSTVNTVNSLKKGTVFGTIDTVSDEAL